MEGAVAERYKKLLWKKKAPRLPQSKDSVTLWKWITETYIKWHSENKEEWLYVGKAEKKKNTTRKSQYCSREASIDIRLIDILILLPQTTTSQHPSDARQLTNNNFLYLDAEKMMAWQHTSKFWPNSPKFFAFKLHEMKTTILNGRTYTRWKTCSFIHLINFSC